MPTLFFYLPLILLFALGGIYAERKLAAYMQERLGPMEVGYRGLLQSFADVLKLLQKASPVPANADRLLFILAPPFLIIVAIAAYAPLPVTHTWHGANSATGVLTLLALASLQTMGIALAGWASNNKYARLGAMRAAIQLMAYEVPLTLSILSLLIVSQTLHLPTIAAQQAAPGLGPLPWGGIFAWNVLRTPTLLPAYALFFVTALAACHRAPFDLPEAESELVAGYHTEYGGIRWAWIMLTEYTVLLLMSLLGVILFLGAGHTPLPDLPGLPLGRWTTGRPHTWAAEAWAVSWLVLKALLVVAIKMTVRWTFPRLRIDQVVRLCWQYLTPAALLLTALTLAWQLGLNL